MGFNRVHQLLFVLGIPVTLLVGLGGQVGIDLSIRFGIAFAWFGLGLSLLLLSVQEPS